jgi:hypothetical protein
LIITLTAELDENVNKYEDLLHGSSVAMIKNPKWLFSKICFLLKIILAFALESANMGLFLLKFGM